MAYASSADCRYAKCADAVWPVLASAVYISWGYFMSPLGLLMLALGLLMLALRLLMLALGFC